MGLLCRGQGLPVDRDLLGDESLPLVYGDNTRRWVSWTRAWFPINRMRFVGMGSNTISLKWCLTVQV